MASIINASTSGVGGVITTADNSGILNIQTAGTTAITVNASQNVGVGVTPSAWNSGFKAVQLGAVGAIWAGTSASNGSYFANNYYFDVSGTRKYLTNGFASEYSSVNATHVWSNAPSSTAGATATFTERMAIDASGNLMVGKAVADTGSAGVWIYNANATQGRINLIKTVSGNVDAIGNYYSGTYVGGITYSNTATALVASSDARLKQNIVKCPEALSKIKDIEVVSYDWKHDPTHVEFGFVAQQLNNVYSEAVSVGDDEEELEKTWGVEYGRLTPILVKAIQEQQALITNLTSRLEALEGVK
jgi:hypothetical protein